jgi:urease accessory protein
MPTTFLEGLWSGIGHPAIGLDHLTFVVVLGIVAAMAPAGATMIASFVVAAGVVIHAANFEFALSEQLVSFSVVIAGVLLATW